MKDKSKCPTCCSEVNYHVEGGTSYYTPVDITAIQADAIEEAIEYAKDQDKHPSWDIKLIGEYAAKLREGA